MNTILKLQRVLAVVIAVAFITSPLAHAAENGYVTFPVNCHGVILPPGTNPLVLAYAEDEKGDRLSEKDPGKFERLPIGYQVKIHLRFLTEGGKEPRSLQEARDLFKNILDAHNARRNEIGAKKYDAVVASVNCAGGNGNCQTVAAVAKSDAPKCRDCDAEVAALNKSLNALARQHGVDVTNITTLLVLLDRLSSVQTWLWLGLAVMFLLLVAAVILLLRQRTFTQHAEEDRDDILADLRQADGIIQNLCERLAVHARAEARLARA